MNSTTAKSGKAFLLLEKLSAKHKNQLRKAFLFRKDV